MYESIRLLDERIGDSALLWRKPVTDYIIISDMSKRIVRLYKLMIYLR